MFKHEEPIDSDVGTEKRLLEAAGEIFAEYGYRAATIRQICEKAGANIAAVNYHFGDKDGLYMAVLRFVHQVYVKNYPSNLGLSSGATAEQRLRAYVQSLLYRIFEEGRPGWHMKLMAREMMEPTRAFDTLVEEAARPLHQELTSILRELLGPRASDATVRLCTLSILGQGIYYHRARSIISRLYPRQGYGPKEIEALAEHITQFSLFALQGMAKKIHGESQ
jgi:TetR/AcrR family transcriptional regulator, regulator of cefoperazone and chloramphenicol sensitivity